MVDMLRFDDRGTIARVEKRLARVEQRMEQAVAIALTRTVQSAQKDEIAEMRDVFDRPKPFTLRGTYIQPAKVGKLRAAVGLAMEGASGRAAGKYLRPQVFGGQRRLKGYEITLRNAGILPNGYYTVLGEGARQDGYGNIQRGQLNQIFSYFRVEAVTAGYNRASTTSLVRSSTLRPGPTTSTTPARRWSSSAVAQPR